MPTATNSHRIADTTIEQAEHVNIADIATARGLALKRSGAEFTGPCPHCAGRDRFAIHVTKQVFHCRGCGGKGRGAISFIRWIDNVEFREAVEALIGERAAPAPLPYAAGKRSGNAVSDHDRRQHGKAAWLWSQRRPITGTIAETYLREARGITCPLPARLGFLQSRKADQHPR
jgi:putative DNA primase/helicase